MTDIALRGRE